MRRRNCVRTAACVSAAISAASSFLAGADCRSNPADFFQAGWLRRHPMNANRARSQFCRTNRLLRATLVSLAMPLMFTTLRAQILPPPPAASDKSLAGKPHLFVREFQFEGNTVFKSDELAKATAPFTNRELHTEDLEQARRAVTLQYINRGYINSGAVIPDQDPKDGIIRIRIIEGRLTGTELRGNRWLRDGYIKGELRRRSSEPLNLYKMQEGLQLLRENPN